VLVWFSDWDSRDTFLESSAIFSQSCGKDAGGGGGFATWLRFASAGDVEDSAAAAPLGWSLGIGVGIIAA